MIPNQNILTEMTTAFRTVAENAVIILTPYALNTLLGITLIAIMATTLNFLAIEDSRSPNIMFYITKNLPILFKYASFTFMVTSYSYIINALVGSFFKIGGIAGGSTLTAQVFSSPSLISQTGMKLMIPFWENYVQANYGKIAVDLAAFIAGAVTGGVSSILIKAAQITLGATNTNSIAIMLLMALITILIIGCFFIMAVNVFVLQIEFAIIAALSLMLIPFGVWGNNKFEGTYFIFNNAKTTFINLGIKYMVLTTIMSISMAIINTVTLPTSPSYTEMLFFLLMVVGITAMTIFLPNKITAEMQG